MTSKSMEAVAVIPDTAENTEKGHSTKLNSKLVVKTQKLVESTKQFDIDDLLLSDDNPRVRQALKQLFPLGWKKLPQSQVQAAIKKITDQSIDS